VISESKKVLLKAIFSPRMFVALIMGFACGLPLALTTSLLQAWMKNKGVDLGVIGLMSLVGLPYTLKFLWAPLFDRFTLPFLGGRRKGWILAAQIILVISIIGLGSTDPVQNPWMVAFAAFLVTFFSASQDINVDAYRREDFLDEQLGLASSLYIFGYRVGMLLAAGGGLIMAAYMPFSKVYLVMALCLLPGILTTVLAHEPSSGTVPPGNFKEAVIDPFIDYFSKNSAIWILVFILLYKIGDNMAGAMTIPFYLELGFTNKEIGAVVKIFGFWATISGTLLGGLLMLRLGINKSLWIFGVLQALSTACFALLIKTGPDISALTAVISFENLTGGMGTAAFVAFMASITNRKFTVTQYALLSSLMGIPRVFASAPTGYMVKGMGWSWFFIICTLIAIPGMLLLLKFAPWNAKKEKYAESVVMM